MGFEKSSIDNYSSIAFTTDNGSKMIATELLNMQYKSNVYQSLEPSKDDGGKGVPVIRGGLQTREVMCLHFE